jgi:hypothetical protein
MDRWTCPRCDRTFGRRNRPHVCEPGLPLALWLDERTEPQRRAAEAVLAVVRRHRELVVEAVQVGVLIRRERTIIELRPKTRWLELSFVTPAAIASDRIARTLEIAAGHVYFVHLRDERDVDRELRAWLDAAVRVKAPARARASRR